MVTQNRFTEFFSQWGCVGTTVAWGNSRERVMIARILHENNNINVTIYVESTGIEKIVPVDELYPLLCESCNYYSFIGLIRCEGCEHRQCPNCMEQFENKCGFGC